MDIKDYLRGSNLRIQKASQIVKTTPPSEESGFLYINSNNFLIKSFAERIQENGFLMHVGVLLEMIFDVLESIRKVSGNFQISIFGRPKMIKMLRGLVRAC